MTVCWSFPTRIVFGVHAVDEAGRELRRLGCERVLLVTDPRIEASGVLAPLHDALNRAGVVTAVFDGVGASALESDVVSVADAFRHAQATGLVAVGGGSVLDVAKLARVAVHHPLPLAPYAVGGDATLDQPLPPLVAVPTTAGSGAEVSGSARVLLQSAHRKALFKSERLLPSVALLDPAMTVTLSPRLTATTGMAALARCVEAYCTTVDHPMADAIALNGIVQALSGLERAVHDGEVLEARAAMLKASMMGSVAAQKGLGVCDALAQALATEASVPHGVGCSLLLPHVLDFNRTAVPDRVAKLARLFGVRGDDVETLAFECAGAIRALRKRVGLPDHLAACSVDESVLPRVAAAAAADPSRAANPRAATEEDLLRLLHAAM